MKSPYTILLLLTHSPGHQIQKKETINFSLQ